MWYDFSYFTTIVMFWVSLIFCTPTSILMFALDFGDWKVALIYIPIFTFGGWLIDLVLGNT